MLQTLIARLQRPEIYPHPVKYFHLIETHISVVILTGDYAYKIKKPLDMEFLDYSTLEKRKFYCEKELRINKDNAPDIYMEVIEITGSDENPVINGKGSVIEYAIKMREFPQESLYLHLIQLEKLIQSHFTKLADELFSMHQKAEVADANADYGLPSQVFYPVQQNFDQIRPLLNAPEDILQLDKCEKWAQTTYQKLSKTISDRKAQGFVRCCHGDLHLGNIVFYKEKPVIFDAIEFNPNLEWTDVMADVGFLTMDLLEKKHANFAIAFLNRYLTLTGDYSGLRVLRFYQAYRAVVRAKINIMGYQQKQDSLLMNNYYQSMKLAEELIDIKSPRLIIMHGIAGSGKTTQAKALAEKFDAIHLRSDVERKRLFDRNFYSEENIQKIYDYLLTLTTQILEDGISVIVDATFLKQVYRMPFMKLAETMGLAFSIVVCEIADTQRTQWLNQRLNGYSDADIAVAKNQSAILEPLSLEEKEKIL